MINNEHSAWRQMLARFLGMGAGAVGRDTWGAFGWPMQVGPHQMWTMYLRNGVAHRIVRAFPQATWAEVPIIRDEAGSSEEERVRDKITGELRPNSDYSPFVHAVGKLFRSMRVLRYLERADRLSGIGQFGVLLMGFRNGDSREPLEPNVKNELIYLAAYGEPNVTISEFDEDRNSPRYGLPKFYSLSSGNQQDGGRSRYRSTIVAHHSRVIHVSEILEQDEVFGTPALLPVYNLLLDLEKVTGAGAEAFWFNARGGMSITADKDAKMTPEDIGDMKQQADDFENQLRRILALRGAEAKMLATTIADPKSNVETILDQIAGAKGMPKRILIGSERGELASSQDESNWDRRVDERQRNYATPTVLMPFVETMISTGNLPQPKGEFWVEWSNAGELSPERRAEYAGKMATAISTYSNSLDGALLVPEAEFRSEVLGLPPTSEFSTDAALDEEPLDETDDEVVDQFAGAEDDPAEPVTNARQYRARLVANARPRTLYVSRTVKNAEELRAHFRAQDIDPMTPAEEMHVTIAYSRTPLDWSRVEPIWNWDWTEELVVPEGGMRLMELFGKTDPKRFLVLQFSNAQLSWRHQDVLNAGGSWDFPSYEPHVSVTTDVAQSWGEPVGYEGRVGWESRLRELEPWRGRIVLGPEIWREVEEGWSDRLVENAAE